MVNKSKQHQEGAKRTKVCRTCKESKELSFFTKDKQNVGGYKLHCKVCINLKRKESKVIQAANRLYQLKNAKRINETARIRHSKAKQDGN